MWRAIAKYNRVDDPLRLPSGSVLVLPAPEELV
jgi:nucleoid-associated protein YgaU